jgi:hypothetical protein
MKLFRRSSQKQPPEAQGRSPRSKARRGEGSNETQSRPDPKAEPIPDGEHKYVPRSPYRTGNW